MEQSVLAIIEAAKQSGQKELGLSGKCIEELPESIGQLTSLTLTSAIIN